MNSKIATMIGFAFRSRKYVLGSDNVLASKKVKAVFVDESLAENSRERLLRACTERNVILAETNFETELVGVPNGCKVIGLTDRNMIQEIAKNITQTYRVLFGGKYLG